MSHNQEAWPSADARNMALSRIQVVEVAQGIAGPYTAKLLADMRVKLIKVEPHGLAITAAMSVRFPDISRTWNEMFLYLNTNKFGIALNLDSATGAAMFGQPIDQTDILIEDGPPGWLGARGRGYHYLDPALKRPRSLGPTPQTSPRFRYRDTLATGHHEHRPKGI